MKDNDFIFLSPSKLNLFLDCPLCFWLAENKKIHRPEKPTSTLPRGMDLLIKKYFDKCRKENKIPTEIEGKIEGKLLSHPQLLKEFRSNGKFSIPRYVDEKLKGVLYGALDECIVLDNYYIPVDYKTYGFELKENSSSFYQLQLDAYTLMLESSGFKTLNFGYLIYYIPTEILENGLVKFKIEVIKVETNPQRAREVFEKAILTLKSEMPNYHTECSFCHWGHYFNNFV